MKMLTAAILCTLFCVSSASAAKHYSYFRLGNPNDISASTTPGTVLMGGQEVTSSQALVDPSNRYITLDRDFVNVSNLAGLLDDPHFVTRDRMGRDLAFMCRAFLNGWSAAPRNIAIDEQTALLIDGSGNGTVVSISTVYFMQAPGAPELCQARMPLTYHIIAVYRINASGTFNLTNWTGTGVAYTVTALVGVPSSTQSGGAI
jgi:cyanophycinase-like exopeptidase